VKAVFDSGPVIHLSWIGYLYLLPELFDDLLMPPAVHAEVLAPPEDARGFEAIRRMVEQGEFRVQQPMLPGAPDLSLPSSLGLGEAEAIYLAEDVDADLFVSDDAAARTVAKGRGLSITGTLGILKTARHDGLIRAVLPLALELRRLGQWLNDSLIAEIEREEHGGPVEPPH
jgi:predicted nucleic acid-binding protein